MEAPDIDEVNGALDDCEELIQLVTSAVQRALQLG